MDWGGDHWVPWSPLKLGYEVYIGEGYTVFYPQGTILPEFYRNLSPYLMSTAFTLKLPQKKHIILMRVTKKKLATYLPWMKTEDLGGVALQTGNRVFVSFEKLLEKQANEADYVNHELTHTLLHQNSSLKSLFSANAVPYMAEGLPVHFGGPHYYEREEFLSLLKAAKFTETTAGNEIYDDATFVAFNEESGERYRVTMMVYGELLGYLRNRFGDDLVADFVKAYLQDPLKHRELFLLYFKSPLHQVIREFDEQLTGKATALTRGVCRVESDCETPVEYLIQSRCPFGSICLDKVCRVVCPQPKTGTNQTTGNIYELVCTKDAECDCSGYTAGDYKGCRCADGRCVAIVY